MSRLAQFTTAALLATLGAALPAASEEMRVTLLGTGSPVPNPDRYSQSTLVEAGSQKLLFDFGRGAPIRLTQLAIPLGEITAGFITHMHSDHVAGLPDVWLTGWIATPFGLREAPLLVYGPKGTEAMTANLTEAFSEDIRIRQADEHLLPEGIAFDAHDIEAGVVYEKDGVTVTAFDVEHGALIKPSYGYKIEYGGKTVVISGDTTYDAQVIAAGKGADLLIHEVAWVDPRMVEQFPSFKEVLAHHTTPEEAGRVFTEAAPDLAVYAHIVSRGVRGSSQQEILAEMERLTRETYDGPLVMGEDLMAFELTDDGVVATDAGGAPLAVGGTAE